MRLLITISLPTHFISVAAGCRLPIGPYLLYNREGRDQMQLNVAGDEDGDAGLAIVPPMRPVQGIAEMPRRDSAAPPGSTSSRPGPATHGEAASTDNPDTAPTSPKPTSPPAAAADEQPAIKLSAAEEDLKRYGRLAAGNNPRFVEQYYEQSRLHHLSTSGTYARATIRKLHAAHVAKGGVLPVFSEGTRPDRVIVHIDLDSFFVSIGLRSRPELRDKPVVISHGSKEGRSEISSCNYVARSFGIHNGELMASARAKCPDLQVLPYEFDKYREASEQFYHILASETLRIEAVSMDEAYLDLTGEVQPLGCHHQQSEREGDGDRGSGQVQPSVSASGGSAAGRSPPHSEEGPRATAVFQSSPAITASNPRLPTAGEVISRIRARIQADIGITASAGIAHNVLLARMCTRRAKLNGQYCFAPGDDPTTFIDDLPVTDLPGVGWATASRLQEVHKIKQCSQLRALSLDQLQSEYGERQGEKLYQACRGIDPRPLKFYEAPKIVSVEISWGVRFANQTQVEDFVKNLVAEVVKRLRLEERRCRHLTFKVLQRRPDAGEPYKFLGCGHCIDHNRSHAFAQATDSVNDILEICLQLLRAIAVPPVDVRGIGIALSKLEDACAASKVPQHQRVTQFFRTASAGGEGGAAGAARQKAGSPTDEAGAAAAGAAASASANWELPDDINSLDPEVLEQLPPAIRQEIERQYEQQRRLKSSTKGGTATTTARATSPPPPTEKSGSSQTTRKRQVSADGRIGATEHRKDGQKASPKKTKAGVGRTPSVADVFMAPSAAALGSQPKRPPPQTSAPSAAAARSAAGSASAAAAAPSSIADALMSPSQWSADVMAELPPQLVEELQKAAEEAKSRKEKAQQASAAAAVARLDDEDDDDEARAADDCSPGDVIALDAPRAALPPGLVIDPEYLAALPPDMRREVEAEAIRVYQLAQEQKQKQQKQQQQQEAAAPAVGHAMPDVGPSSPMEMADDDSVEVTHVQPVQQQQQLVTKTTPAPAPTATFAGSSVRVKQVYFTHALDGPLLVEAQGEPHLLHCVSRAAVDAILRDWVLASYGGACDAKQRALAIYILGLLQHKRLDEVLTLLRSFRRLLRQSPQQAEWAKAYTNLAQSVQQCMQELYSARLDVPAWDAANE